MIYIYMAFTLWQTLPLGYKARAEALASRFSIAAFDTTPLRLRTHRRINSPSLLAAFARIRPTWLRIQR
jgi:hypothetical protein